MSIYEFSELLSEAWGQSMTVKNITSGFKVTGVYRYPVDRNAVQVSGHKPTFRPESLAEKSGLAYIPFIVQLIPATGKKQERPPLKQVR